MKVVSIDHIAIYVKDLQKSKDFFEKVLGLPVDGQYGDEIFFKVGNQKLAIFQGDNTQQTVNHIAIGVENFEEAVKAITDKGYQVYDRDMVNDPNNIPIQIVER